MKKLLLIPIMVVLMLLSSLGCAGKKVVAVHPGSVSDYDSYAYDLLLTEQAAITEARAQFVAGKLPAEAHDPLNKASNQYNATLAIWKAYHATGGDATALQQAINVLVATVGALQGVLGKPAPAPLPPSSSLWLPGGDLCLA